MSECKLKKRIRKVGLDAVDEVRKEFPCYECNLRCVFCGRDKNEFKEWFLKWFGDEKK